MARQLADDELVARVHSLAAHERGAMAELIAHLVELDRRRLHLVAGYNSLFAYCREALFLSESEAYNRIKAVRAARRFPVILDMLAEGAVTLTTVRLLGPHLTAGNHLEVLRSARGLRKLQVEALVARLAPHCDAPASIRKLPSAPVLPPAIPAATTALAPGPEPTSASRMVPASPMPVVPTVPRPATVNALSPDRYKLQVTISGDTLEKLELAKDLLRHVMPAGDVSAIVDRALTALLTELARKRFAATDSPRPSPGVAEGSRDVPAEVKRAVFLRDGGRCAFVGTTGRRCGERGFVELHHVWPYAEGGRPTVDNIELRCRQHNALEWEQRSADIRLWKTEGRAAAANGP